MKKIFFYLLISLSIILISCSSKTDKDIYNTAKENLESENYTEALLGFEELVANYPKSEYYQEALLQTGELNQGHVNKSISYEKSLKKAIKSYRLYHTNFPDDAKAPQTLFMIGFMQANELGEYDSAKVSYTKFVELYPDNEMAESAKTELENIGLTPDQILEKKMKIKPE